MHSQWFKGVFPPGAESPCFSENEVIKQDIKKNVEVLREIGGLRMGTLRVAGKRTWRGTDKSYTPLAMKS